MIDPLYYQSDKNIKKTRNGLTGITGLGCDCCSFNLCSITSLSLIRSAVVSLPPVNNMSFYVKTPQLFDLMPSKDADHNLCCVLNGSTAASFMHYARILTLRLSDAQTAMSLCCTQS